MQTFASLNHKIASERVKWQNGPIRDQWVDSNVKSLTLFEFWED